MLGEGIGRAAAGRVLLERERVWHRRFPQVDAVTQARVYGCALPGPKGWLLIVHSISVFTVNTGEKKKKKNQAENKVKYIAQLS